MLKFFSYDAFVIRNFLNGDYDKKIITGYIINDIKNGSKVRRLISWFGFWEILIMDIIPSPFMFYFGILIAKDSSDTLYNILYIAIVFMIYISISAFFRNQFFTDFKKLIKLYGNDISLSNFQQLKYQSELSIEDCARQLRSAQDSFFEISGISDTRKRCTSNISNWIENDIEYLKMKYALEQRFELVSRFSLVDFKLEEKYPDLFKKVTPYDNVPIL